MEKMLHILWYLIDNLIDNPSGNSIETPLDNPVVLYLEKSSWRWTISLVATRTELFSG